MPRFHHGVWYLYCCCHHCHLQAPEVGEISSVCWIPVLAMVCNLQQQCLTGFQFCESALHLATIGVTIRRMNAPIAYAPAQSEAFYCLILVELWTRLQVHQEFSWPKKGRTPVT